MRVVAIRVLALLVLMASGVGAVIASAQDQPQTIAVAMTGSTIKVAEPWQVVPSSPPDAEREVVRLVGTNDNLLIGYIATDSSSGDFLIDLLGDDVVILGSLTNVDTGPTYSLQTATINGVRYGVFTVAHLNRYPGVTELHSYFSPVSTFAVGMMSAYESVTVNGVRVLRRVDAGSLQNTLTRAGGVGDPAYDSALAPPLGGETRATDVVVVPPTVAPAEHIPTTKVPQATDPVATAIVQPEATAATTGMEPVATPVVEPVVVASPESYVYAGVVTEGLYVSPMTGSEVRWSANWGLAPDADYPSAGHDYDRNVDFLNLVHRENGELRITIEFFANQYAGVERWASEWTFYARASLQLSLESDGVYASTIVQRGDVILMAKEATLVDDGIFSVVTLLTPIPEMPDTIAVASSEITINGNPSFVFTTPEKVRTLMP